MEVENLSILQRLAARINQDALAETGSDPMYVAYLEEGNDIGGIDSGFLVKSSRVEVVSVEQVGKDYDVRAAGAGSERAAAASERSAAARPEGVDAADRWTRRSR